MSLSGKTVGSKRQRVAFPADSRLVENMMEVLKAFDKVRRLLDVNTKIQVDFSTVESISMSTILYLINLFDRAKSRGYLNVTGNFPAFSRAQNLLEQSGFYKYVSGGPRQTRPNQAVFPIRDGTKASPELSMAFSRFTFDKSTITNKKAILASAVYESLLEATQNVADYAYEDVNRTNRWWAGAIYKERFLEICVLDNSRSILTTMCPRLQILKKSDPNVIVGAFAGQYSSTKKANRGKGLSSMKEAYESGYISELQCISRRGMVDLAGGSRYRSTQFYGTLLRWKVKLS